MEHEGAVQQVLLDTFTVIAHQDGVQSNHEVTPETYVVEWPYILALILQQHVEARKRNRGQQGLGMFKINKVKHTLS